MATTVEEPEQLNKKLNYGIAIVLGSGGFYFGYYVACFNPFEKPILEGELGYVLGTDSEKTMIGLVNMLFAVGAMVGVLFTGALADRFGRRPLLIFGEVLALLCVIPYSIANIYSLLFARFISGAVAGVNSSIFSIMMAEMLPNSVCGFGNGFSYFALTLAILISYLTQNIFNYDQMVQNWRLLLLWPAIISLLRLILFPIYIRTDTPKYLYNSAPNSQAGELAVRRAYGLIYSQRSVDAVASESIALYEKQKTAGTVSVGTLFGPQYRKRLFSGCYVAFGQQVSGINFLIFYSTTLFNELQDGLGKTMTLVVGICNFTGSIIVIYLISRLGRKFNLVMGPLFQSIAFFILYIGYIQKTIWILIVSVCLYIISFAIGLGGTETAYIGEILPPAGVGLALAVQWIMTALIGQFLPALISIFGSSTLIIFFAFACLFFFFTFDYFLIETKGKSEQQIITEFESGHYRFLSFLCPKKDNAVDYDQLHGQNSN